MTTGCPACGARSAEGAVFCIRCGFSLRPSGEAVNPGLHPAGRRLAQGDLVDGKYRVEKVLGEGGMGIVYLARDVHMDMPVVIKSIRAEFAGNPEYQARILAEGRALARIDHPNVVRLNAVVVQPDALYLVMQFIEGETLEAMIHRYVSTGGTVPLAEAIRVFRGILEGIAAVHDQGVIHRDLKPANILIRSRDGIPKVTDFGIAKWERDAKAGRGMTKGVIGSLFYMAPEQVRGQRDVDKRVDIYALGILLFELVTGRVPFDAPAEFDIMRMHAETPLPSAVRIRPDLPLAFDEVLNHACAKNRDERYPSCGEFLHDLARVVATTSTERREPRPDLYLSSQVLNAPGVPHSPGTQRESLATAAIAPRPLSGTAAMVGMPIAGPAGPGPTAGAIALSRAMPLQATAPRYGAGGTRVGGTQMASIPDAASLAGPSHWVASGEGQAGRPTSLPPRTLLGSPAARIAFLLGVAGLSALITVMVVWVWPRPSRPHRPPLSGTGTAPSSQAPYASSPAGHQATPSLVPPTTNANATATSLSTSASTAVPGGQTPPTTPQVPATTTTSVRTQLEALTGPYSSVPSGQPPSPARDYRVDVSESGDALEFHIVDAQQFDGQGYSSGDVRLRLRPVPGRSNAFWVEDRLRPKAPPGLTFDPAARESCLTVRDRVDNKALSGTYDSKTREFAVTMVRLRTESDKVFDIESNRIVRCDFASAKTEPIQSRLRRKKAN